MDHSLNPASQPRRGVLAVLGAALAATLVGGALVLGGSGTAAASGLARFASCAELRDWGAEAMSGGSRGATERFETVGQAIEGAASADASAPMTTVATAPGADGVEGASGETFTRTAGSVDDATGGTNVVVEGIDEPDLVERLGGDRALVVGGQVLAIADLAEARIEAGYGVPWGAQVTYDADASVAWVIGNGDDGAVQVHRVLVGDGSLTNDGVWSTAGQLVSVRRQGGELLLVATDGFVHHFTAVESSMVDLDPALVGPTAPGGSDDGVDPETGGEGADDLPFGGTTVPCDQVLHPEGPADPSSTMLVVLPVSGALEPVRATQVVGSGGQVHVTADAAYLATPTWDPSTGAASTGIHRFDLASLTHTGSGAVDGSLLNDFSMSEHGGHLRVAVTAGGGGFVGAPVPMPEPMPDVIDPAGDPITSETTASEPVLDGPAESPMVDDPALVEPDPDAGPDTTTDDPDTPVASDGSAGAAISDAGSAVDPSTGSGTTGSEAVQRSTSAQVPSTTIPTETTLAPAPPPDRPEPEPGPDPDPERPGTTTTIVDPVAPPPEPVPEPTLPEEPIEEPIPVDPFPMPTVVEPPPISGDPLNEIVVLDIDGDLDVVGRTPRFGKPGETIHGIRFDADIAYAVTFLQTDPFYVVDLADPANPTILGELELPGFSAYLHPISTTEVVGFGPDETGRASAKLFDVADRANPRVVDSIVLGDESPVTWDHHAFVSLGANRFAVPASSWGGMGTVVCDALECYEDAGRGSGNAVVVLEVSGGRLVEVDRVPVTMGDTVQRIIPASDGWGLLGYAELVVVDATGAVRGTVPLG